MSKVKQVLKERGNRYGEFNKHAKISQELKAVFYAGAAASGKSFDSLPDFIQEAVEMIFHKLARVANGDPLYIDSYRDIAGFAQLVIDELEKTTGASDAKVTNKVRKEEGWVHV